MIIDFHTHVFPDKIASKTIDFLSKKGGVPAFSDGTVNGLLTRMEQANVDICITLPVITNPAQFDTVNRFAADINREFANKDRRIISFAGIHPDCEDIDGKMSLIANSGFRGVKIHPDYQDRYINDERYIRILQCAAENDLIVVTHAGVDIAYSEVHCPPTLAAEVIKRVPDVKLVLAHLGGAADTFDETMGLLCGENVYFDTAYVLRFIKEKQFKMMLEAHSEDKILFASDSPWSDIKNDIDILRSFDISDLAKEKIFYENAKALLKL